MADILQYEKSIGEGIIPPNECIVNDKYALPQYYKSFADKIFNLDIRPDDIWVCSFPKSGTTWTQEMVWGISNDLDSDTTKKPILSRFPYLEYSTILDRKHRQENLKMNLPDVMLDSVSYVDNLKSPRFAKCHLPFEFLPLKLQNNSTGAKIVHVTRNPRDICVSYYHQSKSMYGYKDDFQTFCDEFMAGKVRYGPYWDHILGYWKQKNSHSNILFITYEEMKKDLRSVIIKTANFLNKPLSENKIEKLLDHLSFEKMKKNPAVNWESLIEYSKKHNIFEQDAVFMRSGKIGNWKDHMTPEMIQRFQNWEKGNLKDIGVNLKLTYT